jgi:hypothetical protein
MTGFGGLRSPARFRRHREVSSVGLPWRSQSFLGTRNGFPTALRNFRHFSPEVPDSPHIAAYPCIFHYLQPLQVIRKAL